MVRFVDQMSVSNSENEDILSFGEQQRHKQDKFECGLRCIIGAQAEPGQRWILRKEGSSGEKVFSPAQAERLGNC